MIAQNNRPIRSLLSSIFYTNHWTLNAASTKTSDNFITLSRNIRTMKFPVHDTLSETIFNTIDLTKLCDSICFIVKCPTAAEFEFDINTNYTNEIHDFNYEEVMFGKLKEHSNKSRWSKFLGGRVALRRALKYLQIDAPPILKDDWGAPTLPFHIAGSISHKDNFAVGVAREDKDGRIGVDLEHTFNKAASTLWRRVLTPAEQSRLGNLTGTTLEEEVLLRFSYKEAVYKAIHPFLKRSVDFSEVEVDPLQDGTAKINFLLKSGEQFQYMSSWQRYREKYWLTCVYVWDPSNTLVKYR